MSNLNVKSIVASLSLKADHGNPIAIRNPPTETSRKDQAPPRPDRHHHPLNADSHPAAQSLLRRRPILDTEQDEIRKTHSLSPISVKVKLIASRKNCRRRPHPEPAKHSLLHLSDSHSKTIRRSTNLYLSSQTRRIGSWTKLEMPMSTIQAWDSRKQLRINRKVVRVGGAVVPSTEPKRFVSKLGWPCVSFGRASK